MITNISIAPAVLWTSLEAAVITGGRNSAEWKATGVCLNVSEIRSGDLFFASPNDDLKEVFKRGAVAAVVPHHTQDLGILPLLKVYDVFEALRALARAARFKTHAQVVAVQGPASRQTIINMLTKSFDVYSGRRNLSLGLAGMPESSDFCILGFSPQVRPTIAVVTDCATVDLSVFETMPPHGKIILNADSGNLAATIAHARTFGIRNIFTYGQNDIADVSIKDSIKSSQGTHVRLRVMDEEVEFSLSSSYEADHDMLAAFLILKLSDFSLARISSVFSLENNDTGSRLHSNVSIMGASWSTSAQAAFRVINSIDKGYGRRLLVLDNIGVKPQKTSLFSNKTLDIPLKIDNLELVYACSEISLFSNAEAAVQKVRPAAALGAIIPAVLGPGDFLTFKELLGKSKKMVSTAMRLTPVKINKKTSH